MVGSVNEQPSALVVLLLSEQSLFLIFDSISVWKGNGY